MTFARCPGAYALALVRACVLVLTRVLPTCALPLTWALPPAFALFAMPVLLLGFAIPETAWAALPFGWAAAIWGLFLYWWAGVAYVLQAARMIRDLRVAGAASSDTVHR